MNVREVIEVAKEWVELQRRQMPDLIGAHLVGSLPHRKQEDPFPHWGDVDIHFVVRRKGKVPNREVLYQGIIVESAFFHFKTYQSPEKVLANPILAAHLAIESILYDPTGHLERLHRVVAEHYQQRLWVRARYKYLTDQTRRRFRELCTTMFLSPSSSLPIRLDWLLSLTNLTTVGHLQPPTIRKCLLFMRTSLLKENKSSLYQELLQSLGSSHMTRARVEIYLQQLSASFDRAMEVKHKPAPYYPHKFYPHLKAYHIEGAREMIERGDHREAMFWIVQMSFACNLLLQRDAPKSEQLLFQAQFDLLLEDLGQNYWTLGSATLLQRFQHIQCLRKLMQDVFTLADGIVENNPDIID